MALSVPLPDNYLSRAPQQQARRAVEQAVLAGEKFISFSMPTGTGKTRVWVALLVALFASGFQRFIIALPNLNLLDQLKRHYLEVLKWKGVFYVCSEPGTDATDEADFRRSFPAASEADLREIYARKQVLIVTTYASLPKVLQDIPASMPVEALFLDEAHHEEGPVVREALETHSAKYAHKISTSATLLPSHQPCYTYSLSAAIHDNVIKDYQLYICLMLATGTGTSQSKIKFIKEIAAKTGNTHLIVYVTFSEADREDTTSVRKLVAELGGDPELWVEGLTGGHTREQRQATQTAFATPLKGAEKVKLLVNCRVLGEGADISAANGVVFDKTTTDPTQLQQNIGRALRKPDGETVPAAAVLFMILVSAEELAKYPVGAERNAALVEQVYDTGPGHLAMVAIAALMKQDPAKVRELMGDNQRVAFTRARPDRAVVETAKETVRLTMPDGFDDEDEEDLNGLADAIAMGTDWPAAEVQTILRGLTEDRSSADSSDGEDEDEDEDEESSDEGSESSENSSEEPEPFVQRLSDRLGCDVVIHYADSDSDSDCDSDGGSTMVASQPVGAYDKMLELLKTPTGYDLVVPAADKDNERYAAATAKTHKKRQPVNFMLEQELKEQVSLSLSDDTDFTHGLTARLEVSVNAEAGAETKLPLFFKAVDENGAKALKISARVDEEGQLVALGGWKIGRWFSKKKMSMKNPSKKEAVYASLTQDGTNEIVKANLEKFLAKQDQLTFKPEDKLALFQKAVKMNGAKALEQKAQVDEEGQLVASGGWAIGNWFNTQKQRMKTPSEKEAVFAMLTQNGTNEIVKKHLDKFLAHQDKPKKWYESKSFSDEAKLALFQKAVEIKGAKALAFDAQVDKDGQLVPSEGWPVGKWLDCKKQKSLKDSSKKDTVFDMLTQDGTNEIVKAHLDKFLAEQDQPEEWYESKSFSDEAKMALFHKAVEVNSVRALAQKARVDEEGQLVASGGWKIGLWFGNLKKRGLLNPSRKDAVYASLTQDGTNEIVKTHLDKFLAHQDKSKEWFDSKSLSDEAKLALCFKAVKINGAKALAFDAQVDKEGKLVASGGWRIGGWFNAKKQSMKDLSKKDNIYASLTQNGTNKIVKANLDKFLAEQNMKKRKASDEVFDGVVAAAEPPKKRQKTSAAAAPAPAPAPASRKRPAAAIAEPEEEQQPKPKRARKQPAAAAPAEPLTYDNMSEADKKKLIEAHLRQQQQQKPAAGYCTTNPDAKDNINGVLARFVPAAAAEAASDAKVIFLDHTEFKTAYALLETGRVRPEHMLIPQWDRDPAVFAEMARHELFGPSVVPGDFNEVLERFLAGGGVVRSVYGDFCSTQQAVGLPFVELLTKYRTQLAPAAVVGVTVTRRNPEGVRYQGQDIVKMNTALSRLLGREPENLFHTAQMAGTDGQPLDNDDPYTYGDGQPMATWLIRTAF